MRLMVIVASAILAVTFAYIALRWRKSPKVFKAMNVVAGASAVAGVLAGLWVGGIAHEWSPFHKGTRGSASTGASDSGSVAPGPEEGSTRIPDLKGRIGVFAVSNSQEVVEVPCYGSSESIYGWRHFTFKAGKNLSSADCVPRIPDLLEFLVNLPAADVASSQVYAFDHPESAKWGPEAAAGDPEPLKDTKQLLGNITKIESEDFRRVRQKYIALVVRMPLGTPDRMYVVKRASGD
jgi:hypothetical protein